MPAKILGAPAGGAGSYSQSRGKQKIVAELIISYASHACIPLQGGPTAPPSRVTAIRTRGDINMIASVNARLSDETPHKSDEQEHSSILHFRGGSGQALGLLLRNTAYENRSWSSIVVQQKSSHPIVVKQKSSHPCRDTPKQKPHCID
jgi:hypothetical protein